MIQPPEVERRDAEQAEIAQREGTSLEAIRRQVAAERARRKKLLEMTLSDLQDYLPE